MKTLELVDLKDMIAGKVATGNIGFDVTTVTEGGSYKRKPHTFINREAVADLSRRFLEPANKQEQIFPPLYQVRFENVHILGQGTLVVGEKFLIRDSCWEFIAQNAPIPGLRLVKEGLYAYEPSAAEIIPGPVCLLKRPFWRNYGHWLVDTAAWLALLRLCRVPNEAGILIGDTEYEQMKAVVSDTIRLLAPDARIIPHKDEFILACQECYYMSPAQRHPDLKNPHALFALRSSVLPVTTTEHKSSARLFLARRSSGLRMISNQVEVDDICDALGFTKIFIEDYSLQEQAAMFNKADCIMGVKGAAFANLIFARANTKVILLSPADWADLFFWDIATALGMNYVEVFGRVTESKGGSNSCFEIDRKHLQAALAGSPADVAGAGRCARRHAAARLDQASWRAALARFFRPRR